MMKYLQRLGRSLMLPVACLPAAAILLGVGYWIDPTGWGSNNVVAAFLIYAGKALIDNMAILFAVGVALGMSEKQDGTAALAGVIGFLVVTTLLKTDTVYLLMGSPGADLIKDGSKAITDYVNPAFGKINNQFIGILCGLVASVIYNKFKDTKLPDFLSFFSGKRCVAIVTSVVMLIVSGILYFIWPVVYSGLVSFGTSISSMGPLGAGIYAFFNRLLIPIGMHHPLNSVFWFDAIGINDIGVFWGTAKDAAGNVILPVLGKTGMYQAGFFPIMMFGVPAAALAMYHTAKDNKKKVVAGLLMAGAFSAFFTGVTEPLEFSFMFLAPGLYLIHAILTGISVFLAASLHWMAGFGFSAGLIDFVLSFKAPGANKPYMLLLLGAVFFVVYYVVFRFVITKFNLKTPGREDDEITDEEMHATLKNNDFTKVAAIILEGLGGKANVTSIDNCITRIRAEIKDYSAVDEKKIKSAGVAGVIRPGKTSVQVIVGTKVQFVADEMNKML